GLLLAGGAGGPRRRLRRPLPGGDAGGVLRPRRRPGGRRRPPCLRRGRLGMGRVEFALPDVGEGLEEGEIVSWLVGPGDTVVRDQPLVEVQTDKALVELPSPVAGQVVALRFAAGDIVKVGQVLVVLEDGGEPAPLPGGTSATSPPAPEPGRRHSGPGTAAGGRPKAAPAVRKLALDRGVDLATVAGTGPSGRILASDVEAAAAPQTGVPHRGMSAGKNAGSGTAPRSAATGVPDRAIAAVRNAGSEGGLGWLEAG